MLIGIDFFFDVLVSLNTQFLAFMSGQHSHPLGRTSAKIRQLATARESALKAHARFPLKIDDAKRFAFSIIVNGARYTDIESVFLWNDIIPPSSATYYRAQAQLFDVVKDLCLRECAKWRAEMKAGAVLAFDGSWSHRRNAKECVVVFIDCALKKIVDFEIVQKVKHQQIGNYEGSSNGMEVEALRRLIARWYDNPNVAGCVHDNDSKASKAIREVNWQIAQYYDPNHIAKCFDRRWTSHPHAHLRGLQGKLRCWFNFLIRTDFSPEQRIAHWRNTLEHLKGNHTHCLPHTVKPDRKAPLADNERGQMELEALLEATVDLIQATRSGLTSQMCESYNAVKAHYAQKSISWKVSWSQRIMCAILQVNSPEAWKFELFFRSGLRKLHSETLNALLDISYQRIKENNARRSADAQRRERHRRADVRNRESRDTTGQDDYRLPETMPVDATLEDTIDHESQSERRIRKWSADLTADSDRSTDTPLSEEFNEIVPVPSPSPAPPQEETSTRDQRNRWLGDGSHLQLPPWGPPQPAEMHLWMSAAKAFAGQPKASVQMCPEEMKSDDDTPPFNESGPFVGFPDFAKKSSGKAKFVIRGTISDPARYLDGTE